MKRFSTAVLLGLIGLLWAVAGVGKLAQFVLPADATSTMAWADQFSPLLVISVAIAEVCIALLIFSSRFRLALILGMFLLASFSVVIWFYPPPVDGQSCGCLGVIPTPKGISPMSHIVALSGLHAFALAIVWPIDHKKSHTQKSM